MYLYLCMSCVCHNRQYTKLTSQWFAGILKQVHISKGAAKMVKGWFTVYSGPPGPKNILHYNLTVFLLLTSPDPISMQVKCHALSVSGSHRTTPNLAESPGSLCSPSSPGSLWFCSVSFWRFSAQFHVRYVTASTFPVTPMVIILSLAAHFFQKLKELRVKSNCYRELKTNFQVVVPEERKPPSNSLILSTNQLSNKTLVNSMLCDS